MRNDPHLVGRRDEDVLGGAEVGPLLEELAFRIEYLNAIILAIADVDKPFGVGGNRVRSVELTWSRTLLTPSAKIVPV